MKFKPQKERENTKEYTPKLTFKEKRLLTGQLTPKQRKAQPRKPWVSNRKAEWKDSDSIALAYKKGDK